MNKILILTSDEKNNPKEIIDYFSNRNDIEISMLSNIESKKLLKLSQKLKIKYYHLQNNELPSFFQNEKYDVILLDNFNKILDDTTIKTNNFISYHESLLPKYKTPLALKKAYFNNDLKTGITIYKTDENLYEGKILFQKELKVSTDWSLSKLENEIKTIKNYYLPRIIEKLLKLNVLVIGSSAKEQIIVEKISKSNLLNKLFLVDSNDFFKNKGENINCSNLSELIKIIRIKNINLVIIGNEKYYQTNVVDLLKKEKIKVIGLNKKQFNFATTKSLLKDMLEKYNIKTPQYKKISNIKHIENILQYFSIPIIRPNGFVFDKEAYIENNIKRELEKYLIGKYDNSSKTSIIEEKINGEEICLYSFWDGQTLLDFPYCKIIRKKDNIVTQPLASICPIYIETTNNQKINEYKIKLKNLLIDKKIDNPSIFCSFITIAKDDIYITQINPFIENCQFQALMNYIQNDWLEIFFNQTTKMLNTIQLKKSTLKSYDIEIVSNNYPKEIKNDIEIKNIDTPNKSIQLFFSDTIQKDVKIFSKGPRFFSVVSSDKNEMYKFIENLDFDEKNYILDTDLE